MTHRHRAAQKVPHWGVKGMFRELGRRAAFEDE
jgi:hypothetical protein